MHPTQSALAQHDHIFYKQKGLGTTTTEKMEGKVYINQHYVASDLQHTN